jgi:hypothetical protein
VSQKQLLIQCWHVKKIRKMQSQCLQKKVVDDSVCPKYIVDVMSPSISTLVEDENKKTRYYAIASINDCHYLNIWADGCPRWSSVKKNYWGDVSYWFPHSKTTPSRRSLRLAIPIMESKTDPAPTTEIQLQYMYWDGKRHYGKKTLKSPKLLLNTAWVNSVWDTKEDQSEWKRLCGQWWNYRRWLVNIEDIPS